MRCTAFLALTAAVAPLGGCILAPVPVPEKSSRPFGGHQTEPPSLDAALRDGASTREDLILVLGRPDRVWDHERFMVYESETVRGRLLAFVYAGVGAVGGGFSPLWGEQAFLLVEFESSGTLRRHEIRRRALLSWHDELGRACDDWSCVPPPDAAAVP